MSVKRIILGFIDIVCKVVLTVIAVMFIIRAVRYAYDAGLQIFDQKPVNAVDTRTVVFTVNSSDSVSDVGGRLEEKGLIKDAKLFLVQERLSVYHDMITPGTYELSPSMTADAMIEIMARPAIEARKNAEEKAAGESAPAGDTDTGKEEAAPDETGDDAGMAPKDEAEPEDTDEQPPEE